MALFWELCHHDGVLYLCVIHTNIKRHHGDIWWHHDDIWYCAP